MNLPALILANSELRLLNNLWVRTLPERNLSRILQETGLPNRRRVDESALLLNIIPERFLGLYVALGSARTLLYLLNFRAAVVGDKEDCIDVVLAFVKGGVGNIRWLTPEPLDFETVQEVRSIYEGMDFRWEQARLRDQNIEKLLPVGAYDLVVAVGKDVQGKFTVLRYCQENKISCLYSIISGNIGIVACCPAGTSEEEILFDKFPEDRTKLKEKAYDFYIRILVEKAWQFITGRICTKEIVFLNFETFQANLFCR